MVHIKKKSLKTVRNMLWKHEVKRREWMAPRASRVWRWKSQPRDWLGSSRESRKGKERLDRCLRNTSNERACSRARDYKES